MEIVLILFESFFFIVYVFSNDDQINLMKIIKLIIFSNIDILIVCKLPFLLSIIFMYILLVIMNMSFKRVGDSAYDGLYLLNFYCVSHLILSSFIMESNLNSIYEVLHVAEWAISIFMIFICKAFKLISFPIHYSKENIFFMIFMFILTSIYPLYYTMNSNIHTWTFINLVFMFILLILTCMGTLTFHYFKNIEDKQVQLEVLNHMINYVEMYSLEVNELNDNMNKLKHDFKKEMNVIKYLYQNKKGDEASILMNKIEASSNISSLNYTSNIYIDAYLNSMKKKYSDFKFKISGNYISEDIDNVSLLIIFMNLVDNAYQYTKREILIEYHTGDSFILKVSNSIDQERKGISHGLGLDICRNKLDELKGNMIIDNDKSHYSVYIEIPLIKKGGCKYDK